MGPSGSLYTNSDFGDYDGICWDFVDRIVFINLTNYKLVVLYFRSRNYIIVVSGNQPRYKFGGTWSIIILGFGSKCQRLASLVGFEEVDTYSDYHVRAN